MNMNEHFTWYDTHTYIQRFEKHEKEVTTTIYLSFLLHASSGNHLPPIRCTKRETRPSIIVSQTFPNPER